MNDHVIYILKGVSGCGKSTLAEQLAGENGVICCADDYFMVDGKYMFNPTTLFRAHEECRIKFSNAVDAHKSPIIVANTNIKPSEWEFYVRYASNCTVPYKIFHLIIENHHGNKDVHMVPDHVRKQQNINLLQNAKLM